jgi:hypothetical protein
MMGRLLDDIVKDLRVDPHNVLAWGYLKSNKYTCTDKPLYQYLMRLLFHCKQTDLWTDPTTNEVAQLLQYFIRTGSRFPTTVFENALGDPAGTGAVHCELADCDLSGTITGSDPTLWSHAVAHQLWNDLFYRTNTMFKFSHVAGDTDMTTIRNFSNMHITAKQDIMRYFCEHKPALKDALIGPMHATGPPLTLVNYVELIISMPNVDSLPDDTIYECLATKAQQNAVVLKNAVSLGHHNVGMWNMGRPENNLPVGFITASISYNMHTEFILVIREETGKFASVFIIHRDLVVLDPQNVYITFSNACDSEEDALQSLEIAPPKFEKPIITAKEPDPQPITSTQNTKSKSKTKSKNKTKKKKK